MRHSPDVTHVVSTQQTEEYMTEQTRSGLKKLQRLDEDILEAKTFLAEFDPKLADVEEPALIVEAELERTRSRLQEMRLEERRLEVVTQEKQTRVRKLEERLQGVRNVREESAVNAELDMVRAALSAEEGEVYSLLEQIRRFELNMEEMSSSQEAARAEVEPRQKELLDKRDAARKNLAALEKERHVFALTLDAIEIRTYDAIHSGGGRRALASLTEDGACGNCYSVIPLQLQQEIRDGTSLIRCEGCGVILAAPDEVDEEAEAAAAAEQAEAEAAEAAAADAASDDASDESTADGEEEPTEA